MPVTSARTGTYSPDVFGVPGHRPGRHAALAQPRQFVRDDRGADIGGVTGQGFPVASARVRETLEGTTVEKESHVAALAQERAAGDRSRPAQEAEQGRKRYGGRRARDRPGHGRPSSETGRPPAAEPVTHRFEPGQMEEAYDVFGRAAGTGAIKVVLGGPQPTAVEAAHFAGAG
ncbi:hypothetical protein [Streptomyces sp. NPDC014685]|uniref:hypothetical protein n=1 Tax=Streptomyces sp. NPDC014685 TaxID=3364881 RepID=UPI003700B241